MIDLATILTILNIADKAKSLHTAFTGVSIGSQLKQMTAQIEALHGKVHSLTDQILWSPTVTQAVNLIEQGKISESQLKQQVDRISPFAEALGQKILLSSVSRTPERLRNAFDKDPYEVLLDPRPINRVKRPNDPDLVPIMFMEGGQQFIGWQKRGVIPSLFDCEFDESTVLTSTTFESTSVIAKTTLEQAPRRPRAVESNGNLIVLPVRVVRNNNAGLSSIFKIFSASEKLEPTKFILLKDINQGNMSITHSFICVNVEGKSWIACTPANFSKATKPIYYDAPTGASKTVIQGDVVGAEFITGKISIMFETHDSKFRQFTQQLREVTGMWQRK